MRTPDLADHSLAIAVIGWTVLIVIVAMGIACTLDKF